MKTTNRVLSIILCMLILLSVILSAPFTVSAADDYTFEENGIRYLELDDSTLSVVDINSKIISEELVIPKTAGGKTVTQIGANAFTFNRKLKKVTVEADITTIGDYAFEGCTYFTEINLPDSLTYIGKRAFANSNLASIQLPKNLETIGANAFLYCQIKQVTIPASVKTIGASAFDCNYYLSDVVIEPRDTLLSLENRVFVCSDLKSFDFTYCGKIGKDTFYGCDGLTSITLPSHIDISSAVGAFRQCSNLKTVNFPDNINFIPDSFFSSCKSLENINASKITSIGDYAFSYCEKLTNYDFTYCNKIGQKAFSYCTGLTSITLPSDMDLTSASGAFSKCTNLNTVNLDNTIDAIPDSFFSECTSLENIDISKITSIGSNAFSNCVSITNVDFSNCTVVGNGAFSGCTNLKNTQEGNITSIGNSAFSSCKNITDFSFANCTDVGDKAFFGCTNLKNIQAGNLNSIGKNAFSNCTSLTSFDFSNCTYIGDGAFSGCTGFTCVALPNKEDISLGGYVFDGCTNLKTVKLSNSIDTIKDYCFNNCTSLESIETGTIKAVGSRAFYNCENLVDISFVNDNKIERVYSCAFYNCVGLTEITLNNVVYINESAFENCTNLVTVDLENNTKLKSIGTKAFYNCTSLERINIPASCTEIGEKAFMSCENLYEVDIKSGLEIIGSQAFFNCHYLYQIVIPKSVERIGGMALGCFEEDGKNYSYSGFMVVGVKSSLADDYADAYDMYWALNAPKLTKIQNTSGGVKITFSKSSGASSGKYDIYRCTDSTEWKKIGTTTSLSYTDKTAKAGTKYYYTVQFVGKPTNSITDIPLEIVRLTTPSVSKITNTNDGAQLTIKAVEGASKYRVYVRSGSSWKSLGTTDTTTFTHKDVKSGTTYKYTVRAYDSSGESVSAYNSTGFSNKFIAPPQITKTSNTETGIKITWGKVEGAENYRVFVKSGSSWKKLKDTTSTSFTHTGVESGKTYTYTVRCISSTGKSYKSGYDTVGTKAMFLSTPAVTKISNTVDGVKLTYKESIGASKYSIYANSGSGFKKIGESTTTTFVHENAKSGTSYTYRVRAYDNTGDFSSYYKTSSKNTFIAAPVIKELESTSKGVKITWDKVTGAAKYRVFVKSGSSWKKLKDTTATTFTHTGVESGKEYTYTVRCISSTGKSYTSGYDTIGSSIIFEK